MSTLSWVPRVNISKTVVATPAISANAAYTTGDQLGGVMTLTDVVRQDKQTGVGNATLSEVTILDGDAQSAAIDVWFFKIVPTPTSTDNAPFAISLSNQAAQCIGSVALGVSGGTGTYSAAQTVSTSSNINLNKNMQVASSSPNPTTVYAIAIVRGAPTYTTVSSLQFQFTFFVD